MSAPGIVLQGAVLRDVIACALPAASEDTKRPHLCAVQLILGGRVLQSAATNGHMLVRYQQPVGTDGELTILLSAKDAADCVRALRGKNPPNATLSEGTIVVGNLTLRGIDETFPPIEQVIPKPCDTPCAYVGLDVKYLAVLAASVKAITTRSGGGGLMVRNGPKDTDPVLFTRTDYLAVIMPVRL